MRYLLLFSAAALLFTATAEEIAHMPAAVYPEKNLLKNSGFSQIVRCTAKQMQYYSGKKVSVKKGELPAGFTLLTQGQPQHAVGTVSLHQLPDRKNRYISISTYHNKFDSGTALLCDTPFQLSKENKEPLYCGIWAKGNGTLIVKFLLQKGKKFQDFHVEKLLTVPTWHYYRIRIPERARGKGMMKLSLSAYGRTDFAFPEIAPLPAVDKTAELLFYVPFEKGSLQAKFSRGPVMNYGTPALMRVPGKTGDAGRFDRKRRFDSLDKMQYHFGFGYDFLGKALDRDRGTIEFFFRPLDEMLQKQTWGNVFPLFYLGDTTWQWANAQDFSLVLERLPGNKLLLSCVEHLRKKSWPNEILMPNTTDKTTSAFIPDTAYVGRFQSYSVTPQGNHLIKDAKAFIGKYHHLAFTYDEKGRTVWLDGKPVIQLKPRKKPAVSSKIPKLLFALNNFNHPATMSSDIDELKVYSGVKYHAAFTPSARTPRLKANPAVSAPAAAMKWKSGTPSLSKDKKALCFPLERGKDKYTLEIACPMVCR